MKELLENYISDVGETFRSYKKLAEKSLAQISDEEFFKTIDKESNSVATISKHIAGNLRSRWTDFLTSDGEKPDRNRDSEFVAESDTRESLTEFWENGWNALFLTLETLTAEDLEKTVTIRGENYPVFRAINRSLTHTASHVGQIMFLAKHFRSDKWKTLSVPKNKSSEFNSYLSKNKEKAHYLEATREFAENADSSGDEELKK